jgi:hypothetical protein
VFSQQEVDGRRLPLLPRLGKQADARVDGDVLADDVLGAVGAAAGDDHDLVDGDLLGLLREQRLQQLADVGLFVVGHDAYAAANHGGLRERKRVGRAGSPRAIRTGPSHGRP